MAPKTYYKTCVGGHNVEHRPKDDLPFVVWADNRRVAAFLTEEDASDWCLLARRWTKWAKPPLSGFLKRQTDSRLRRRTRCCGLLMTCSGTPSSGGNRNRAKRCGERKKGLGNEPMDRH